MGEFVKRENEDDGVELVLNTLDDMFLKSLLRRLVHSGTHVQRHLQVVCVTLSYLQQRKNEKLRMNKNTSWLNELFKSFNMKNTIPGSQTLISILATKCLQDNFRLNSNSKCFCSS